MALQPGGVVEIRSTGASTNGCYYDSTIASAGTDYSQQDAAQLTIADGDCNNSTTLTSVTGGFTSAMIGNGIYISGTGYTTSVYVITAVASSNSVTLDRNPTSAGGHPTTGACSVGGANTIFQAFQTQLVGGMKIYIKKGTYTWTGVTVTIPAGSATASIKVIGYNSTRDDSCFGTDRPSITTSLTLTPGTSNALSNLIFSGSVSNSVIAASQRVRIFNVKATNTVVANQPALNGNNNAVFIACEGSSANGIAFQSNNTSTFISCYAHDSVTGFDTLQNDIINCVVDTCTTGVNSNSINPKVIGSTIYNCTTGITFGASATAATVVNSIITGCTTGISADAAQVGQFYNDYNVFNNTTDVVNFTKGPHCVTANPLLNDPSNGDFTLQDGSPAIGIAAQIGTNVGAAGVYNTNVGVYQNELGGAGAQVAYVG